MGPDLRKWTQGDQLQQALASVWQENTGWVVIVGMYYKNYKFYCYQRMLWLFINNWEIFASELIQKHIKIFMLWLVHQVRRSWSSIAATQIRPNLQGRVFPTQITPANTGPKVSPGQELGHPGPAGSRVCVALQSLSFSSLTLLGGPGVRALAGDRDVTKVLFQTEPALSPSAHFTLTEWFGLDARSSAHSNPCHKHLPLVQGAQSLITWPWVGTFVLLYQSYLN